MECTSEQSNVLTLKGATMRERENTSVNASQGNDIVKIISKKTWRKKNGHTFRLFAVDPDSNFEFPQSAQFASGEPTAPELRPKERQWDNRDVGN